MMKSCLKQPRPLQRRYSSSYCPPPCYSSPSPSSSLATTTDRRQRQIYFGRIEIREHAYILGDNPSVSDGAPVSISWKCHTKTVYEVECYEAYHPSTDRRSHKDASLKLGVTRRAELLLSAGYSMADIMERTLKVANQKTLLQDSIRHRKWDTIHATIEKTTRKIRKVARRSSLLNTTTTANHTKTTNTDHYHDHHSGGKLYNGKEDSSRTTTLTTSSCTTAKGGGDYPSSPSSLFDDIRSPKSVILNVDRQVVNRDIDFEPRIDWAPLSPA